MLPATLKPLLTRPGRWLALLVVLGMVVVVTPLVEIWRRHGLEMQTAFDARRALEAVAGAVQTQRALSAHRPYAAAVLAGRSEQEPERLRRQQAVDSEVGALVATLEARRLHRALDEADQLRNDWSNLLEGIGGRRMHVMASDLAHALLVEQAFVIMDLAASAGALHGQVGRAFGAEEWTLALHTLPRFALALAAWGDEAEPAAALPVGSPAGSVAGSPAAGPTAAPALALHPRLAADARRATKAAAELLASLDAAGADEPAPDPALVRSLVALRQSASQLSEMRSTTMAAARRAQAAGLEASAALFGRFDAGLAESVSVLQRERQIVAAAGLLAMLVAALAAALAMPRTAAPQEQADGDDAADAPDGSAQASEPAPGITATSAGSAESRGPASDLLHRLRRGEIDADSDSPVRPKPPAAR
ncbi:MAG: hypothetical protein HZC37_26390 [Burkholderiales bacterium]|nr:hypothetical protein [Burkholderiales bacterium]